MRKDKFCYFHTTLRRRHRPLASSPDTGTMRPVLERGGKFAGMEPLGQPSGGIELGLLEDTASVQVAISIVVNALANNRLEVRRASALLYGLQLAASNCCRLKDRWVNPEKMLRHVTNDEDGEAIASPGLNSGSVWAYPNDPAELSEDEREEMRLDDATDEMNGGSQGGDATEDGRPIALTENEENSSHTGAAGDDPEADAEQSVEHDADDEANKSGEEAEDDEEEQQDEGEDEDDFEDAACERAFSDFRELIRKELGPQMAYLRSTAAMSLP